MNQPSSPANRPPQPWDVTQPARLRREARRRQQLQRLTRPQPPRRRLPRPGLGCFLFLLMGTGLALLLAIYFLTPGRTNLLILGVDYIESNYVARTDTLMLVTVEPSQPYVGVLSIPRDLWVNIPSIGENRINTAHFFAEAQQAGSGPAVVRQTIAANFGVRTHYYIRLRFEAVRAMVNAMGGVDIYLPEPAAGYPAGWHHLSGNKALAFARHRMDSDDFFRMEHGQLLVKAILQNLIQPRHWKDIPEVWKAFQTWVDTDIPLWLMPRLGLAVLRLGPEGIDTRVISREMVTPFITSEGADVLAPKWELILPLVAEMFGSAR